MPRPARILAGVLACLLAALPAACGDEEPHEISGRALRLRVDEYRIMPQNLRVQAGRLRLLAHNVGRLTHNVKIVRQDEDDLEAPPEEIGGTRTAQPGETVAFTFERLPPGEYRLVCTIANHDDLGQYGKLVVEEPG